MCALKCDAVPSQGKVRDEAGVEIYAERLPYMKGSRPWMLWLASGRYEVMVDDDVGGHASEFVDMTEDGAALAVHVP